LVVEALDAAGVYFLVGGRRGDHRYNSSERKSPPENYGKEDQTTVAAFLPWRGS